MLSVSRLRRPGLGPIDLKLAGGEVAALQGPSGTGKTMLLRAIADLDPNEGEVLLDGEPRERIAAPEWRRDVAYVAAESGWWEDIVGAHFDDIAAARRKLSGLGLEDGALSWPVTRLSTGEKQRLALIRSIIQKPRVLLLDEPTSALDGASRALVESLLGDLAADGISILIVTHDTAQAARLGARVLEMHGGRLVDSAAEGGA